MKQLYLIDSLIFILSIGLYFYFNQAAFLVSLLLLLLIVTALLTEHPWWSLIGLLQGHRFKKFITFLESFKKESGTEISNSKKRFPFAFLFSGSG